MTKQYSDQVKQIYFFILGVFLIFLFTLFKGHGILKEVILIMGWVPISEMVRIKLLLDSQSRVRRRVLRKLIHSEIVERI